MNEEKQETRTAIIFDDYQYSCESIVTRSYDLETGRIEKLVEESKRERPLKEYIFPDSSIEHERIFRKARLEGHHLINSHNEFRAMTTTPENETIYLIENHIYWYINFIIARLRYDDKKDEYVLKELRRIKEWPDEKGFHLGSTNSGSRIVALGDFRFITNADYSTGCELVSDLSTVVERSKRNIKAPNKHGQYDCDYTERYTKMCYNHTNKRLYTAIENCGILSFDIATSPDDYRRLVMSDEKPLIEDRTLRVFNMRIVTAEQLGDVKAMIENTKTSH